MTVVTFDSLEDFMTALGGVAHRRFVPGLPAIPWGIDTDDGPHVGGQSLRNVLRRGILIEDSLKLSLIAFNTVELC